MDSIMLLEKDGKIFFLPYFLPLNNIFKNQTKLVQNIYSRKDVFSAKKSNKILNFN